MRLTKVDFFANITPLDRNPSVAHNPPPREFTVIWFQGSPCLSDVPPENLFSSEPPAHERRVYDLDALIEKTDPLMDLPRIAPHPRIRRKNSAKREIDPLHKHAEEILSAQQEDPVDQEIAPNNDADPWLRAGVGYGTIGMSAIALDDNERVDDPEDEELPESIRDLTALDEDEPELDLADEPTQPIFQKIPRGRNNNE